MTEDEIKEIARLEMYSRYRMVDEDTFIFAAICLKVATRNLLSEMRKALWPGH